MRGNTLVACVRGQEQDMHYCCGESEGKRQVARPRGRWENNNNMSSQETGLRVCGLASSGSGQGLVNAITNL